MLLGKMSSHLFHPHTIARELSLQIGGYRRIRCWLGVGVLCVSLPLVSEPVFPTGTASTVTTDSSSTGVETGLPFITSYDSRTYQAHSQNWAAVQDDRGVMYFGNSDGILSYDGVGWQTLGVSNNTIVRSLAKSADGTLYVGAVNEIGYLQPDATGNQTYVSLKSYLTPEDANLTDVWRTFATDHGIYFWTVGKLLRWHQQRFESWRLDSLRAPCLIRGQIYNNHPTQGLTVWTGDNFEPLAGGESLAGTAIMTMAPMDEDAILVGSNDGQLFKLSFAPDRSVTLEVLATEVASYLSRHRLYQAIRLPDGDFALATMTGGLVVIGRQGQLRYRITKSEGLLDNSVWSLTLDRERGLWLGLNRGLSRIELDSAITTYSEANGLEGTVEELARHDGSLYAVTSVGLYRLRRQDAEKIADRAAPYWALLSLKDSAGTPRLLIGAQTGVFELLEDGLVQRSQSRNAFHLYASRSQPGRVYVGDQTGAHVLALRDNRWVDVGRLPEADHEVRSISEDPDGNLWLGTHFDGLMRLTLAPGPELEVLTVQRFGHEHGWSNLRSIKAQVFGGRLLFPSPDGLFQFDPEASTFAPSPLLPTDDSGNPLGILRASPDAQSNLWLSLHGGHLVLALHQPDGTYELDRNSLRRIESSSTHTILPEASGVVWLGGVDGLFRVDTRHPSFQPGAPEPSAAPTGTLTATPAVTPAATPAATPPPQSTFSAIIRRVTLANPDRSVLFGGEPVSESTGTNAEIHRLAAPQPLTYDQSSLRFEYTLPRFEGMTANRYRSRLVGLEDAWTDWTHETYRDFTALREDRYRFEVQGRDIYHQPSRIAAYEFRILPPWYRTWWAYIVYTLALAISTFVGVSWLLRRVRLEMQVQQLAEANALMQHNEAERQQFVRQLEAKNADLERVIYGVSHDLKSPLITIRGFLGLLEKDFSEGKLDRVPHDMERIQGAAAKMSTLVNELLELSMVGRVANEPQKISLTELAQDAVEQVAGQIEARGVQVIVSPELPIVYGDRQRLLAMLQNLIDNAVKYMGDQPTPRIEISSRLDGESEVIMVRDNGLGIESAYHEKIFGLFERLSADVDGTGVGLALVQRIVRVHGGKIWVESEGHGHGSTFCFTLSLAASRNPVTR